jgi:hypothetical protein
MSREQHTVLGLLVLIVAIRIIASGRLAAAWTALTAAPSAAASTGAEGAAPPLSQHPTTSGAIANLGGLPAPGTTGG